MTVRVQPPSFDAGRIEILHPVKAWAEAGAKIVLTLGERSADALSLPDDHPLANPLWARWLAEGRITDDLLADVPEPSDRVKAREIAAARSVKLAEIDAAKKAADPHEQAKAAALAATTAEEIAAVKLPG